MYTDKYHRETICIEGKKHKNSGQIEWKRRKEKETRKEHHILNNLRYILCRVYFYFCILILLVAEIFSSNLKSYLDI